MFNIRRLAKYEIFGDGDKRDDAIIYDRTVYWKRTYGRHGIQ